MRHVEDMPFGMGQPDLFDERNLLRLTLRPTIRASGWSRAAIPRSQNFARKNARICSPRHAERVRGTTTRELDKVKAMVAGGRLAGRDKIGVRIGKVVGKYIAVVACRGGNKPGVGKHFDLDFRDDAFGFTVNDARVAAEAALDGLAACPGGGRGDSRPASKRQT